MAQQYGFRASNNFSDVLDRNACWDNLDLDRRDLALLVGTSAAGVGAGDYQAMIGLTSALESQIVATASGASVVLSSLSLKLSKNGDAVLGNLFANIVNNDRPYVGSGNAIYGPSTASFFSPANASGFSSGAQYKLGLVRTTTATVSGFNYNGIAPLWSDYYVRYKQYLEVQEQPSWTTRRSPLYLAPPSVISSNIIWLDSEYSSFEISGSSVLLWRDVLGRANAVQNTSANRPSFVPNRRYDKPGLVFDGANDFLDMGNLSGQFPTAATVVIVATLGETIARGDADYNLIGTLNNTNSRWRNSATGNGALGLFSSAVLTGFPAAMPVNGTYIWTVRASQAHGISIRANSLNYGNTSITYNPGSNYIIGANVSGTAGFFAGTIYAVAMFDAVLSDKEARTVEEYFAWRYDFVFDPERSQTVELEDETTLDTEGGVAFVLG